nr:alkyl sulfatase C-terminal domain-containing protein [Kitasatospora sp. SID7827]
MREGVQPARFATASADTVLAMPVDILFDFAAVHLAGDRAATADLRIGFRITDLDETWTMWVRHGVLNARKGASGTAGLTVAGPRAGLAGVLLGQDVPGAAAEGDGRLLEEYRALLDAFDPDFPVVTP